MFNRVFKQFPGRRAERRRVRSASRRRDRRRRFVLYPIYAKWASDYKAATNNAVNYQSIGSGGGQQQIIAKTVDFGASTIP